MGIKLPTFIDLSGGVFGRLTVVARAENRSMGKFRGTAVAWSCLCECGNTVIVRAGKLRSGSTISCGCFHKERSSAANIKHGQSSYPNGGQSTKEYNTWALMLRRCYKKDARHYHRYGGRGITVCARWFSFEPFFEDMGAAPSKKHSVDRIDNDSGYSPENCRWATQIEQARNTSSNVFLECRGERMTMIEWAERVGISHKRISARIKRGWDIERSIFTPV